MSIRQQGEQAFGEWLRRRRRTLDLTQEDLARQVGCATITISKLEAEERRPSRQMAERLADALKVPPDDWAAFLSFARGDPFAWPAEAPSVEQPLAEPGPAEGLHLPAGTITFLYTDIEGSAQLLERLRDAYAGVLAEQRELLRAAFGRWNGREIDTQGDASFVAFTRALDAVHCVIEAQQALAAHTWPAGVQVRVRMGLHTGEPLVARTGYLGLEAQHAARIAAVGHGGQVLLSQTSRDLIYQDLPPGIGLRSLGEHALTDVRFPQPLYQLDIAGLPTDFPPLTTSSGVEAPPAPGEPPFKGLQYFDEADAGWYFGRETVTRRLAARICDERFLTVIGASGSGKSSLMRAGLVPALRPGSDGTGGSTAVCPGVHWLIFVITPTAHPLEALATSLAREAGGAAAAASLIDALRADPRCLHLHIHQRLERDRRGATTAGQERVLLVVDQFEELFTLCREAGERQAFVSNLLVAAGAEGGGTHVTLALRADFYDQLAGYPGLGAAVAGQQEYLEAMTAEELRRAIEGPAARGGWQFSPGLVDLLLHDVGAAEGHAPEPGALPLLSHALLETWKHRRGHLMNLHAYSESGGVRGAIAHTAERVFRQELTPAQQAIARNLFLRLTELGEGTPDTRRRVSYQELAQESQSAEVDEALARLADARLITTAAGSVEVAHEALIREWPTLRQWLDEDREGLRLHRHLTEATQAWIHLARDPGELYRGTRLGQAADWGAAHPDRLNREEQEFLDAAEALAEQEEIEREATRQRELAAAQQLAEAQQQRADIQARSARQLRRRAVYLLGALVVAVTAALAAVVFGQRAVQSAAQANQNLSVAQAAQATAQGEADARATQQAVAEANLTRAEAERLGAEAINLSKSGGSSELIGLLALRSLKLQYSPEGDAALQAAAALDYPLQVFAPNQGQVQDIDYSPDDRYLSIAYFDRPKGQGTVSIWDIQTGQMVQAFHQPSFGRSTFSPDGRSVLICWAGAENSLHGLIEIRNVSSGQQSRQFAVGNCISHPNWSDDNSVVLAYTDGTSQLFDLATGRAQRSWNFGYPWTISRHNRYMINDQNGAEEALLWNMTTGETITTVTGVGRLNAAAFSPDEVYAAVAFDDGRVQIVRTDTGQIGATLSGRVSGTDSLDFSPDDQYLLSGSGDNGGDKTLRLWRLADGQLVQAWPANAPDVATARFSPDGRFVAAGSIDGTARVWSVRPQPEWPVLAGHQGVINGVTFSSDGTHLATAGFDGVVRLWDVHTGQTTRMFPASGIVNYGLRFSPDGARLLVATYDGTATVWDVTTGAKLWQTGPDVSVQYSDAAFSPDGRSVFMSGQWLDGSNTVATLVNASNGSVIWQAKSTGVVLTPAGLGVDYSPDGRAVVVAATDSNLWLLNAQSGQIVRKFSGHADFATSARLSPDGRYLATPSVDKTVHLWDVATGQEIRQFIGHTDIVWIAEFSPDGKRLATASRDGTVRVWDVANGQEMRRYAADAIGAENVAWSPDGRLLASVGDDGTAKLWDVDYQTTIAYLCGHLQHDLTDAERQQYKITDTAAPCPK